MDRNCIQNIMRQSEVAQNLWSLSLCQPGLPMLMRYRALYGRRCCITAGLFLDEMGIRRRLRRRWRS